MHAKPAALSFLRAALNLVPGSSSGLRGGVAVLAQLLRHHRSLLI
jgi:hypothetical protein